MTPASVLSRLDTIEADLTTLRECGHLDPDMDAHDIHELAAHAAAWVPGGGE
jgi:hypothetical protein